jgi:intein-encoded DNA endonuclease-like protein
LHRVPALESRINAYRKFVELRDSYPRVDVVNCITKEYGLTKSTIYQWFKGSDPLGNRAGKVNKVVELLYVLGALLGDGWAYHWRGNFQVGVVGEHEFTSKFAKKLSVCLGRVVKNYKYGAKNAWFVRVGNAELYFLFKTIRRDLTRVDRLIEQISGPQGQMAFVEGFFDAEGCVKIIREKVRRTPKICLDICNTDWKLLMFTKSLITRATGIEPKLSVQHSKRVGTSTSYHLRIYRKRDIKRFLDSVPTVKLSSEKLPLVNAWLKNMEGRGSSTSQLSRDENPHRTS